MSSDEADAMVAFVAIYDSVGDAEADFESVKQLNSDAGSSGIATGYDAAVVAHDENGRVRIVKTHETPTDYGAGVGAGLGLATGLIAALFPAVALTGGLVLGTTAGGAALGAITGHVEGGLSRGDLKDLGEALDEGTAGLVFVGAAEMEADVKQAAGNAKKVESRSLKGNRRQALEDAAAADKSDGSSGGGSSSSDSKSS